MVIATGISADGRREVLGFAVGESEEAAFWTEFPDPEALARLAGAILAEHHHEWNVQDERRYLSEASMTELHPPTQQPGAIEPLTPIPTHTA